MKRQKENQRKTQIKIKNLILIYYKGFLDKY